MRDHRIVPLMLLGGLRGHEYRCLSCDRPIYRGAGLNFWRHHTEGRKYGWRGGLRWYNDPAVRAD